MVAKSIPEISIDTKLLADRLGKLEIGETVAYDDLSKIVGRDIRNGAYSNLASARRIVLNEKGIVTEAVWREGIKRLNDSEIVESRESDGRRIHRIAKKGLKKLGCVDLSKLSKDEVVQFNLRATHLSILSEVTTQAKLKKLEVAVAKTQQRLPLAQTLEAFVK